ncbi:MAG TPA: ATP12 family protein [Caulobacteraceae bacterium]
MFESLRSPRRFYSQVGTAPDGPGFAVRLDGRTARTPQGRPLILPTLALAQLVADEWAAQREQIVLPSMPATRLAHTAIDAVAATRAETVAGIAAFAADDLVCYFAEGPATLRSRQEAAWTPLLAWAQGELGLEFAPAEGIVHRDQPAATLSAVEVMAGELNDFTLAAVALAAQVFGSAVLALALARGRIGWAVAFAASRIDEAFQAEQWGEDAEAAAGAESLAREARMLEAWFAALA